MHPKLTVAQTFEKSVLGIINQGKPGMRVNKDEEGLITETSCRYLTEDGCRCAVGQVIEPDAPYFEEIVATNPGMTHPDLALVKALEFSGVPIEMAGNMLLELQRVHDGVARHYLLQYDLFLEDFKKEAKRIAHEFFLFNDLSAELRALLEAA